MQEGKETLVELIKRRKLNTSQLSRDIGMHPKTFANKLSGRLGSFFTDDEFNRIVSILKVWGEDISNFVKEKV